MSKHKPKAFTVTELLVVIAIVAVLAALLFPVFSRAAHQSKQSAAKSNLKQLYIGLQLYVEQYDGHSGTLVEQGYPDNLYWEPCKFEPLGPELEKMMLNSPCGNHPDHSTAPYAIGYLIGSEKDTISVLSKLTKPATAFYDANCTEPTSRLLSPLDRKIVHKVDLNGTISTSIGEAFHSFLYPK